MTTLTIEAVEEIIRKHYAGYSVMVWVKLVSEMGVVLSHSSMIDGIEKQAVAEKILKSFPKIEITWGQL